MVQGEGAPSCLGYNLLLYCFFFLSFDKGCSFNISCFLVTLRKGAGFISFLLVKSLIVLLFYLVVDAWKIDMLA